MSSSSDIAGLSSLKNLKEIFYDNAPLNLKIKAASELKWLQFSILFEIEIRLCHIIKRDSNLGDIKNVECSSIKLKYILRDSITTWAHGKDLVFFLYQ